jgi:hypothetical protein
MKKICIVFKAVWGQSFWAYHWNITGLMFKLIAFSCLFESMILRYENWGLNGGFQSKHRNKSAEERTCAKDLRNERIWYVWGIVGKRNKILDFHFGNVKFKKPMSCSAEMWNDTEIIIIRGSLYGG